MKRILALAVVLIWVPVFVARGEFGSNVDSNDPYASYDVCIEQIGDEAHCEALTPFISASTIIQGLHEELQVLYKKLPLNAREIDAAHKTSDSLIERRRLLIPLQEERDLIFKTIEIIEKIIKEISKHINRLDPKNLLNPINPLDPPPPFLPKHIDDPLVVNNQPVSIQHPPITFLAQRGGPEQGNAGEGGEGARGGIQLATPIQVKEIECEGILRKWQDEIDAIYSTYNKLIEKEGESLNNSLSTIFNYQDQKKIIGVYNNQIKKWNGERIKKINELTNTYKDPYHQCISEFKELKKMMIKRQRIASEEILAKQLRIRDAFMCQKKREKLQRSIISRINHLKEILAGCVSAVDPYNPCLILSGAHHVEKAIKLSQDRLKVVNALKVKC